MDDAGIKALLLAVCADEQLRAALVAVFPAMRFEQRGHLFNITFSHTHFAEFYRASWQEILENLAHAAFGVNCTIAYDIAKKEPVKPAERAISGEIADPFGDFICSERNKSTLEVIKRVCNADFREDWLLITLTGASGTGKSLLLNCIERARSHSHGPCARLNGAEDTRISHKRQTVYWHMVASLFADGFSDHVNAADLVSILDEGRRLGNGRAAFLAINCKQNSLSILEPRLHARVRSGLVFELAPPDLATRVAFLEKKNASLQFSLSRSQILALARNYADFPSLEGVLRKIEFYGKIGLTITDARVLEKLPGGERQAPAWQRIIAEVASDLHVKQADMLGKSRLRELAFARQVAMYRLRREMGLSYAEIGQVFRGRNHATVMHAIKKIQELRRVDRDLHNMLAQWEAKGE